MHKLIPILALTIALSSHASENSSPQRPAFEYKVLSFSKFESARSIEEQLTNLGKLGWEMKGMNQVIFNGSHSEVRFYLSSQNLTPAETKK